MQITTLEKELSGCSYPGRGIVIGRSADGTKAVTAYFIMGRSANSRNRVFVEDKEGIRTEAFDPSKLEDPSLIIYAPVRVLGKKTIVTNGDQTDTVYDLMSTGKTFEESLRTREFEPDAPNFTPRISGLMTVDNGEYDYAMSILKRPSARGLRHDGVRHCQLPDAAAYGPGGQHRLPVPGYVLQDRKDRHPGGTPLWGGGRDLPDWSDSHAGLCQQPGGDCPDPAAA